VEFIRLFGAYREGGWGYSALQCDGGGVDCTLGASVPYSGRVHAPGSNNLEPLQLFDLP